MPEASRLNSTPNSSEERLKSGGFLPGFLRRAIVLGLMGPVEKVLIRSGLHPNFISLIGVLINSFGCVLLARAHFIGGAFLILLAGCFDFLDGRVARATGRVSQRGAFLDSVLDRYLDASIFIALAYLYRDSLLLWWVLATLTGSLFTSYVRAKAESLGLECRDGWIQRPERLVLVGLGSFLTGFSNQGILPTEFLWALPIALVFLAISSHGVALQRAYSSFKALR